MKTKYLMTILFHTAVSGRHPTNFNLSVNHPTNQPQDIDYSTKLQSVTVNQLIIIFHGKPVKDNADVANH